MHDTKVRVYSLKLFIKTIYSYKTIILFQNNKFVNHVADTDGDREKIGGALDVKLTFTMVEQARDKFLVQVKMAAGIMLLLTKSITWHVCYFSHHYTLYATRLGVC